MIEDLDGLNDVVPATPATASMSKVERVRRAIADGTYAVDEDRIAEKLIEQGFGGLIN